MDDYVQSIRDYLKDNEFKYDRSIALGVPATPSTPSTESSSGANRQRASREGSASTEKGGSSGPEDEPNEPSRSASEDETDEVGDSEVKQVAGRFRDLHVDPEARQQTHGMDVDRQDWSDARRGSTLSSASSQGQTLGLQGSSRGSVGDLRRGSVQRTVGFDLGKKQ